MTADVVEMTRSSRVEFIFLLRLTAAPATSEMPAAARPDTSPLSQSMFFARVLARAQPSAERIKRPGPWKRAPLTRPPGRPCE